MDALVEASLKGLSPGQEPYPSEKVAQSCRCTDTALVSAPFLGDNSTATAAGATRKACKSTASLETGPGPSLLDSPLALPLSRRPSLSPLPPWTPNGPNPYHVPYIRSSSLSTETPLDIKPLSRTASLTPPKTHIEEKAKWQKTTAATELQSHSIQLPAHSTYTSPGTVSSASVLYPFKPSTLLPQSHSSKRKGHDTPDTAMKAPTRSITSRVPKTRAATPSQARPPWNSSPVMHTPGTRGLVASPDRGSRRAHQSPVIADRHASVSPARSYAANASRRQQLVTVMHTKPSPEPVSAHTHIQSVCLQPKLFCQANPDYQHQLLEAPKLLIESRNAGTASGADRATTPTTRSEGRKPTSSFLSDLDPKPNQSSQYNMPAESSSVRQLHVLAEDFVDPFLLGFKAGKQAAEADHIGKTMRASQAPIHRIQQVEKLSSPRADKCTQITAVARTQLQLDDMPAMPATDYLRQMMLGHMQGHQSTKSKTTVSAAPVYAGTQTDAISFKDDHEVRRPGLHTPKFSEVPAGPDGFGYGQHAVPASTQTGPSLTQLPSLGRISSDAVAEQPPLQRTNSSPADLTISNSSLQREVISREQLATSTVTDVHVVCQGDNQYTSPTPAVQVNIPTQMRLSPPTPSQVRGSVSGTNASHLLTISSHAVDLGSQDSLQNDEEEDSAESSNMPFQHVYLEQWLKQVMHQRFDDAANSSTRCSPPPPDAGLQPAKPVATAIIGADALAASSPPAAISALHLAAETSAGGGLGLTAASEALDPKQLAPRSPPWLTAADTRHSVAKSDFSTLTLPAECDEAYPGCEAAQGETTWQTWYRMESLRSQGSDLSSLYTPHTVHNVVDAVGVVQGAHRQHKSYLHHSQVELPSIYEDTQCPATTVPPAADGTTLHGCSRQTLAAQYSDTSPLRETRSSRAFPADSLSHASCSQTSVCGNPAAGQATHGIRTTSNFQLDSSQATKQLTVYPSCNRPDAHELTLNERTTIASHAFDAGGLANHSCAHTQQPLAGYRSTAGGESQIFSQSDAASSPTDRSFSLGTLMESATSPRVTFEVDDVQTVVSMPDRQTVDASHEPDTLNNRSSLKAVPVACAASEQQPLLFAAGSPVRNHVSQVTGVQLMCQQPAPEAPGSQYCHHPQLATYCQLLDQPCDTEATILSPQTDSPPARSSCPTPAQAVDSCGGPMHIEYGPVAVHVNCLGNNGERGMPPKALADDVPELAPQSRETLTDVAATPTDGESAQETVSAARPFLRAVQFASILFAGAVGAILAHQAAGPQLESSLLGASPMKPAVKRCCGSRGRR